MKNLKLVASLFLAILAIIVALQNTDEARVHILFATVTMSHALLLLVTFAAGGLAGIILGIWLSRSRRGPENVKQKGAAG